MSTDTLTVALVSDVFFTDDGPERLRARLDEARRLGAELALLPELPLNPWSPATTHARPEDAEPPGGSRQRALSETARAAGLAVVGGAIVAEPPGGERRNTALVFDARGALVARYAKLHLPEEEGYWETSHYAPGAAPPDVIRAFALPIGIQICSDMNRPEGCHLLGAMGAEAILAPRATPPETWERWRLVLRANAVTSTAYVLSVNRPAPEGGTPIGGPSLAVDPFGQVLVETTDPVAVVTLDRDVVRRARGSYPGYLPERASLYAEAWRRVASESSR
jgi:predicted amidohydrolase